MSATGTILSSAARTATTTGGRLENYGSALGVMLFLDVTANPGGAETLTVSLEIIDPRSQETSDTTQTFTAFPATAAAANGKYVYTLYPGAVETAATANHEVQGLPLPKDWRAKVTHSSTGSWTYSLRYSYIG